ncbi:MAG: hypothetical protein J6K55_02575 [Clostridia bacterium]|nr:hypothetical protein [Clostridia bacterium]
MILRKLVTALCPLLLCILVCTAFRWIDGLMGSGAFWAFALKGALLGAALSLILPISGVRARTNGLTGWLWLGAGLLLAAVIYQYMETTGAVHLPVLKSIMTVNGQVVLVESAAMGYMAALAIWKR